MPPLIAPTYIRPGHETEAIDYFFGAADVWAEIPGALDWLEDVFER